MKKNLLMIDTKQSEVSRRAKERRSASKASTLLIILALVAQLFWGCSSTQTTTDSSKLQIAASFYPLAEFARKVGGEKIEVFQVVSPGAGPHDFEPTARDLVKIQESKILLINGAGLDPWAEKIKDELEMYGVRIIDMSKNVFLLEGQAHEDFQQDEHSMDPHFWLDPVKAISDVKIIRNALIEADPENEETYINNSENYIKELDVLNNSFGNKLANCKKKEIITSHAAFGYLASRYGFEQIGIVGITGQEEPSAKHLAQLADLAKEKEIKVIFYEALASPRIAETLAGEIGAETLPLNPISGLTKEDIASGKNYVKLMEENLENLRIALECQ